MKQLFAASLLCLSLSPALAQDPPAGEMEQGTDLMQEGAKLLLRGLMSEMEPALKDMTEALKEAEPKFRDLMAMIDDIGNYDAPVMRPNGDILIPRKPDAPKVMPRAPGSDIEL